MSATKSILKKGEGHDTNKKKIVSFVLIDGGRRWSEKLQNPRKGKFDPEEKRLLIKSLGQCLVS